jgi:predicted RNase H-like HicB family nuclease
MATRKATLRIEHTVEVWKEGGTFVARAVPLDVISCGTSAKEARENLSEAVSLFVATAREHGTLETILRECGYRKTRGVWQAPRLLAHEQVRHAVNA